MIEIGIRKVHYFNDEKSKGIEKVKAAIIIDEKVGKAEFEESKQTVIDNINSKLYQYYTVVYNKKCSKVEVVNDEYIRSDANDTKADNLDSLTTF